MWSIQGKKKTEWPGWSAEEIKKNRKTGGGILNNDDVD